MSSSTVTIQELPLPMTISYLYNARCRPRKSKNFTLRKIPEPIGNRTGLPQHSDTRSLTAHTVRMAQKRDRNCFDHENMIFDLWCLRQSFSIK